MTMMRAAAFVEPGRIELVDKPVPDVGPNEALVRITTTTICGTDVHILKGEYPVVAGLTIGHEPVGIIEKLGSNVQGYQEGQRVIAGAICPNFSSYASQDGLSSQDGGCACHGYKPMGGWRFGNTIDGTQAEYVLVPDAQGNLAPVPDGLTDEHVLMCPDIMSTGFAGAEAAKIKIGDIVAIFARGPIGLCATAGARLRGAGMIIVVDGVDALLDIARQMGADVTLNFKQTDVVEEILRLTGGRGVDALQQTIDAVPDDVPVLLDCKAGDIGSTAERWAHMAFVELGAHAITVNPYMGSDAVAPVLEYSTGALEASERCVFLICLTSNPGADDFETLPVDGCPLYRRVAEKAVEWSAIAPCGLVVGATRPQAIRGLRELAPELPFLIPGVGTQGGDLESAVQQGQLASGGGLLINASRGVMYASSGPDFESAARHAAHTLRAEINRFRSP